MSGFKDIAVLADERPGGAARLEAAITLAKAQDAHLTGLVLAVEPDYMYYNMEAILADVYEKDCKRIHAEADARAGELRTRLAAEGLKADVSVLRTPYGQAVEVLAQACRTYDLIIASRPESHGRPLLDNQIVEGVLFGAGQPALLIPPETGGLAGGIKALIAWKPGREAAGAVQAAMPLLKAAAAVDVLMVNPGAWDETAPGADILRHLARHGVTARPHSLDASGKPVGAAILEQAASLDANLLVMGAYGHSRLREIIFGGVTRDVLAGAKLAVLMAR